MSFIYKITNTINNKIYVGYTSRTPKDRFNEHWKQRFSDNSILHNAMKKYGKAAFKVETLEEIEDNEWMLKEQC